MNRITYLTHITKRMDFHSLQVTYRRIARKTGRKQITVLFDLLFCAVFYGAGYHDYELFGFAQMNHAMRKTYLTRGKNNQLVAHLNRKEDIHLLDYKNEANTWFNPYLKRQWFFLTEDEDEFQTWIKDKYELIVKPNHDSGGHGISKIKVKEWEPHNLYMVLKEEGKTILEEVIIQHPKLSQLNSSSVNTIRFVTLLKRGEVFLITAFLRIGNGRLVDNTCSGGMLTPIDLETGVTTSPAIDLKEQIYERHPLSHVKIVGLKIPFFEEAKKMVQKLAQTIPTIRYVAWDIAITETEPILVEANPYPGYYYQFPIHMVGQTGYNEKIRQLLK